MSKHNETEKALQKVQELLKSKYDINVKMRLIHYVTSHYYEEKAEEEANKYERT